MVPGCRSAANERYLRSFFADRRPHRDGRRGVGLGLAICQAIVEAHGGSISAANRPAGGAEFIISLPCTETPPQVEAEATTANVSA